MRSRTYHFMSWLSFVLIGVSTFLSHKYLVHRFYETSVFLILLAILFALWDIADVIREGKQ